jgi:hypothetical protein
MADQVEMAQQVVLVAPPLPQLEITAQLII